jgi:hypothetical protein
LWQTNTRSGKLPKRREALMDKEDLEKIKKALNKKTDDEACRAVERTLLEMGYYLAVPKRN